MGKILTVIPTKNNLEFTRQVVSDLNRDNQDFLIIDNESRDSTMTWATDNGYNIISHQGERNVVSEMWNIGLKEALIRGYEFVAIANNDIRLPVDWAKKVEDIFFNGNVWAIYPVYTEGIFHGFKQSENTFVKPLMAPYGGCGLCGFLQIFRTDIINTIGEFDEGYDLSFQDNDYARRILGERVAVYTNSFIIHHYGSQTVNKETNLAERCLADRKRYLDKWNLEDTEEYKKYITCENFNG